MTGGSPSASVGRDILVVDDREASLLATEVTLGPLKRHVVFARSGQEALVKLLEQDFVLIILDVSMPTMDGFETAERIRARERSRETPIIFVTGFDWDRDMIRRAYRLGAVDFLTTPIDPETLRAKAAVFIALDDRTLELRRKAEELRLAQAREHERDLVMQRRRFEADVAAAHVEELGEANRRKDEFLAILGHELRNPLQPLRTALDLIRQKRAEPVPDRLLAIMSGRLDHIQRLVDDLLDVARINSNRIELHRETLAVHDLVAEALMEIQPLITLRQHVVTSEGDDSVHVSGDRVRLVQVLANLISNATRYTDRGGEIAICWGRKGDQAFMRVSDNGRGIAAAMLERIFEMFVQERVVTDGSEGLGLGLGLAKRLVELHGGTIHSSSPGVGRGSTFEVCIPLAPAIVRVDERTTAPIARSGLRIVVVDDQEDACELVAELLRVHGHDVRTFTDSHSAIAGILRDLPGVALVDIGLPKMDGYEVARAIRRELGDRPLRLIAFTGYGQPADREKALAAGFDEHLVKPVTYAILEAKLRP